MMGEFEEGGDMEIFLLGEYCLLLECIVMLDLVRGFEDLLVVMVVFY